MLFKQRPESPGNAVATFQKACAEGFTIGCQNALSTRFGGPPPQAASPGAADFAIVLREGKGELPERTPFELFTRACNEGWMSGCAQLADAYRRGEGTAKDHDRAVQEYSKACEGGFAAACSDIGYMYKVGDGVGRDEAKALGYLKRACDLGMAQACRWLKEQRTAAN